MARSTAQQARNSKFIPLVRELVRCYQAFERLDARRHRSRGLTISQADVVFTLGNTRGMKCKELGDRTLITKGTLTGVLDRLERKGLIERQAAADDRRSILIVLTVRGEQLFEESYPEHIAFLESRFDKMTKTELTTTTRSLVRLRGIFE